MNGPSSAPGIAAARTNPLVTMRSAAPQWLLGTAAAHTSALLLLTPMLAAGSWPLAAYLACGCSCKDLPAANNTCGLNGPDVVGKQANYDIGRLVMQNGLGGVFPWVLDYGVAPSDRKQCSDNSLFKWLSKALQELLCEISERKSPL